MYVPKIMKAVFFRRLIVIATINRLTFWPTLFIMLSLVLLLHAIYYCEFARRAKHTRSTCLSEDIMIVKAAFWER